jgi:hypothetical protein
MGKIYTVCLNSAQGTNQPYTDNIGTTTTDVRNIGYFFDWSLLPNKKYKLNFNFITTNHTSTGSVCNLFTDMTQLNTRFATPPYSSTSQRLNYSYLGCARLTLIGTNAYLWSDSNFNGTLYLERPPSNNNFTVSLLNNDLNKTPYSSTTLFAGYTLTLTFEELD